jgi:hypothetical protein
MVRAIGPKMHRYPVYVIEDDTRVCAMLHETLVGVEMTVENYCHVAIMWKPSSKPPSALVRLAVWAASTKNQNARLQQATAKIGPRRQITGVLSDFVYLV